MEQYQEVSRQILTHPRTSFKRGSKGSGLISLFGPTSKEYDLRKGFPLLTTKRMATKSIIHEVVWFLSGDTNIKYLVDNGVPIWTRDAFQHNLHNMVDQGVFSQDVLEQYSPAWVAALGEYEARIKDDDAFAARFGDAGPIYGKQWRRWAHTDPATGQTVEIDQLGGLVERLRRKPTTKKGVFHAWNPGELNDMSLEPCHVLYQATANEDGEMDMSMYQRSCDQFLGVPFNLASSAIVATLVAQEAGLTPRALIHDQGDAHFYAGLEGQTDSWYRENLDELKRRVKAVPEDDPERYLEVLEWIKANVERDEGEAKYDHVTAILTQMAREPLPLPTLTVAEKPMDELTFEDFKIEGYESHPYIGRDMAVSKK